jgi:hypothetical protein
MEPERKIEKLLRAFAKKRQADAGGAFKLHPANRRILQGEVAARRAPEARNDGFFSLMLALLHRRLVFALCVLAIAVVGVALLWPTSRTIRNEALSLGTADKFKDLGGISGQYANNKAARPAASDEMSNALATRRVLIDAKTGKPVVHADSGEKLEALPRTAAPAAGLSGLTNQQSFQFAAASSPPGNVAEAPPVVSGEMAASATAPPVSSAVEKPNPALAANELIAGESNANSRRPVVLDGGQPTQSNGPEPVTAPVAITGAANFASDAGQPVAANGPAVRNMPAAGTPATFAEYRFFSDRLMTQTNSIQSNLAGAQNFVQPATAGLQNAFKNNLAVLTAPVLQSFQLRQNGNTISVVDRDGSIYKGSVQLPPAQPANAPASLETQRGAAGLRQQEAKVIQPVVNQQQALGNYFFRVTGMNRTLRQQVVFTGNVQAISNTTANAQQTVGGFGGAGGGGAGGATKQFQQNGANSPPPVWLSNSRIVGTALVNRTNRIEINAMPVSQ